ncbi:MAG: HlyD family type I secretion periplasmic adaptor subunit [Pseudomonadota bacterium]
MRRVDEVFANDIRMALQRSRSTRSLTIILLVVALLGTLAFWASRAELEEVTRGSGRFIASQNNQLIQSLDPGVIAEIYVREGDQVELGQRLLLIDDTQARSELGEVRQKIISLQARRARLTAEIEDNDPDFSALPDVPDVLIAQEQALFLSRRDTLQREIDVALQQRAQRRLEMAEAEAQLEGLNRTIELTDQELEMARRLQRSGAMPRLELIRLERQAQTEVRERTVLQTSLPRIQASISEAQARIDSIRSNYLTQAREELSTVASELAVLDESIERLNEKVERTLLASPVTGIVNAVPLTTIGAVVQPGATLVEIVPIDDALLVEAQISPQDVAFIHAGQKARIKVTAYDYTVYGSLDGSVERISADTITDEEGNSYYQVTIKTDQTSLETDTEDLPIIPGMVVQADILTGNKTVLDYLLKPIKRAQAEALRER